MGPCEQAQPDLAGRGVTCALGEVQALGDALHQHSFTGVIVGDWAPFGPQEMQIAVFS